MAKQSMAPVRKAAGKPTNARVSKASPVSVDRRWEVESAMNTLLRAEELKKNAKLMADVKKLANEQAAKMSNICKKG